MSFLKYLKPSGILHALSVAPDRDINSFHAPDYAASFPTGTAVDANAPAESPDNVEEAISVFRRRLFKAAGFHSTHRIRAAEFARIESETQLDPASKKHVYEHEGEDGTISCVVFSKPPNVKLLAQVSVELFVSRPKVGHGPVIGFFIVNPIEKRDDFNRIAVTTLKDMAHNKGEDAQKINGLIPGFDPSIIGRAAKRPLKRPGKLPEYASYVGD